MTSAFVQKRLVTIELTEDQHRAFNAIAKAHRISLAEEIKREAEIGMHARSSGIEIGRWNILPFNIGEKIGCLTVIGPMLVGSDRRRRKYQRCRCVCTIEKNFRIERLRSGKMRSCGCKAYAQLLVRIDGEDMGLEAACRRFGLPRTSIWQKRNEKHFTVQEAVDYHLARKRAAVGSP